MLGLEQGVDLGCSTVLHHGACVSSPHLSQLMRSSWAGLERARGQGGREEAAKGLPSTSHPTAETLWLPTRCWGTLGPTHPVAPSSSATHGASIGDAQILLLHAGPTASGRVTGLRNNLLLSLSVSSWHQKPLRASPPGSITLYPPLALLCRPFLTSLHFFVPQMSFLLWRSPREPQTVRPLSPSVCGRRSGIVWLVRLRRGWAPWWGPGTAPARPRPARGQGCPCPGGLVRVVC